MKWIIRNWYILSIGLILTDLAVRFAYIERGYIAMGGEWLILPFLFLLRAFFLEVMEEIKRWM